MLKSDELYLVGDSNTDGSGERATGLYVRDTRHLSRFDVRLNGTTMERMGKRILGPATASVTEANRAIELDGGEAVPPHTVALQQIVELHTDLRVRFKLRNFGQRPLPLTLELELGADFRDLFEIRGFPRARRLGRIETPLLRQTGVVLGYHSPDDLFVGTAVDFDRPAAEVVQGVKVSAEIGPAVLLPGFDRVSDRPPLPVVPTAIARFDIELAPQDEWQLTVAVRALPANAVPISGIATLPDGKPPLPARVTTDNAFFNRFIERCIGDLLTLQTSFPEGSLPAAGIPWYVAPFGRDSLTVGLQTFHNTPHRAAGTLRVLAALQGSRHDPFRDEEPGKILHEVRYGEMARLGEIPHTPYYGTVDATPLFVLLFAETVAWCGDERLYRDLLPTVRRALAWMEGDGDPDGDGLIEYRARTTGGAHIIHQGWKDSHDSLHHADGRPAMGAIALVEVQGYAFAAYRRLAEVVEAHGDATWAAALRERARLIQDRVEDLFWLDDEGYYAQALDDDKSPVRAVSSNPGHLLYCGLPSPERGARAAERLAQSDLDSGWGVRTLSAAMPTYNPMSYHNGSVWPHDNSLIAAGVRAYGRPDLADRIATALFAVAEADPLWRLPELYCGFHRAEGVASDAPVPYPVSCSPQAWAAGAGPLMIRTLLGLKVDVGRGRLLVDPWLPDWLGSVTVEGMDVLGARVSMTVRRDAHGYALSTDGPVDLLAGAIAAV